MRNVTVMVFFVNEPPQVVIIPNELKCMQRIVGGYVEAVRHRGYMFWCNEDVIAEDLPFNRWVGGHAVYGTFFVTSNRSEDGETVGLKPSDIPKVREIFAKKEVMDAQAIEMWSDDTDILEEFASYGAGYSEEDGLHEREVEEEEEHRFVLGLDLLGSEEVCDARE